MQWFYKLIIKLNNSSCKSSLIRDGLKPTDYECWKASPKMHYTGKGLDQTKDINEVGDCMSLCRSTSGCDTVDVDSATNPHCWIKRKDFATTSNELRPLASCTNYMSDQGCLDLIEELGEEIITYF